MLRREGDERRGYYADVTNVPGLAWRVLVLDRTEDAMVRARQALLPAALAFLAAACVSILSVFVWSRRLVRPLTTFERRAREVASGGYARPIDVHREDEVGGAVEAFNEMSVRLNSLQDMAQLLAGGSNLSDVLDSVLSATSHILGTGEVAVFLVDEHHTAVDLAAGHGVRRPGTSYRVPLDAPSPIATALADRKMVSFRAPADEWGREVFDLFDADPERQAVAAPLIVGDEMVGVIVVVSEGSHSFSDAKTETLKAFSAHAALAVQNSRLFAQERASRTRAEALREIAEFIAGPIDLEEALERVGSLAADLLGMSGHALAIADRAGFGLERAEDSERHARLLELWGTSAQRSGEKVARLDPVRVLDGTVDSRVCEFLGAGDRTIVLVPLVREDAVTGVLALTSQSDTAALDAHDIALARTIGGEMSLALENAWLLQQARSRAANLETIFRISQAVSSSLQLSVVLNRVLDVVQKIFSADAVSLMAYDAASRSITTSMARGVSSRDMLYLTVQPGQDLPGVVFAQGSPVSHGDLAEVDTPLARLAAGQGLHSMLAVPLLARGRSIGVLSVFAQEPSAFTGEDMELLLTFAVQAALAIDTAGLYGREHHVATVLQASILPDRPPTIAGLETHAFYLPVGLDAEIGGDFYDLFQMRDGRTVIAIGDVCGKGVLAATKTSMIKYSLRGMVSAGATPAEALTELNRLVSVSEDPSDIVTAWIGFLDVSAGSLTYADAGHPPALLHHMTDGGIERLGPTGPLLGALATSSYSEVSVVVRPGDLLLTYTDGVTEARRDGEFFGEDRVRDTVGRAATAEQAVSDLLEQLSVFSSGVMRDDAAVLAVRTLTEEEITRGRDQSQSG